MTIRIEVDGDRCGGHAVCAAVAPEVYRVNEDTGYNEMGPCDVADVLHAAAVRGASACPERAITVRPRQD
jgi:ferredoxin